MIRHRIKKGEYLKGANFNEINNKINNVINRNNNNRIE